VNVKPRKTVGLVYARVELVNDDDTMLAQRGILPPSKVRRAQVKTLVDSGATLLAINERLQRRLGLRHRAVGKAELADGTEKELDIVGPVEIRFANRSTVSLASVLPGNQEPLLGAIPMEGLDVVVLPRKRKLVVNPESPDMPSSKLKRKHARHF
jgi:clan AA aspartic protease